MTLAAYLRGVVLIAAAVIPLVFGAWRLRARLLPDFGGPVARLAEAVLALSLLVVVLEVAGSVGAFRIAPVVAACVVVGAVAARVGRTPARAGSVAGHRRSTPTFEAVAALAAVAVVAGEWVTHAARTLNGGIVDS